MSVRAMARRVRAAMLTVVALGALVAALAELDARRREAESAVRLTLDLPALKYERTDAPAPTPRAGAARLVALGDSVTHGAFVPAGETWPERLAASAGAAAGREVQAWNLAVHGYDVESVVASFEARARAWSPDVVVYGFYVNDPMATEVITVGDRARWVGTVPRPFVVLSRGLDPRLHAVSALFRDGEGGAAARALAARGGALDIDWPAFDAQLDRLVRAVGGTPLVAIVIPPWPLADITGALSAPYGKKNSFYEENYKITQRAAASFAARGVPIVDGLAAYRDGAVGALEGKPGDPHHPSAEGHARLAAAATAIVAAALDPTGEPLTHRSAP